MIKKSKALFLLLIPTLLMLPLTLAGPFDFENTAEQISGAIDIALDIASPFFEKIIGEYSGSDFFFHKILLLFLLIIIIKKVLEKTPIGDDRNKNIGLIISILISVLAIRFINENNFFEAIFIQYGVLGIAITTILPMVIFFYFINNTKVGTFGRKAFWSLYLIMLMGIWISKSSEIPEVANWIYGISIAAVLIFIFLDKSIQTWFGLSHFRIFMKKSNQEAIWRAKDRIVKLGKRLDSGVIKDWEYRKAIKEEEAKIKELSKE